jgi:hypothetical protein
MYQAKFIKIQFVPQNEHPILAFGRTKGKCSKEARGVLCEVGTDSASI